MEDEQDLRELIMEGLTLDGYATEGTGDGEEANYLVSVESYDLIILDLNLPNMSGVEILNAIREHNKEVKILILSARADVSDKVKGLDLGANDYLTKPFHFEELEARIRSLLRREYKQHDLVIKYERLNLDTHSRKAYADGQYLNLTKKEFALLEYLLLNQDRFISQNELIEHIWDSSVNIFSNAIRVHIASLRKKIKEIINEDPIVNKVGEGYGIKKLVNK